MKIVISLVGIISLIIGGMVGFTMGGVTCPIVQLATCADCTCNMPQPTIITEQVTITECRNMIDSYVLEHKQFKKQMEEWK